MKRVLRKWIGSDQFLLEVRVLESEVHVEV